jgi:hypothetical protein
VTELSLRHFAALAPSLCQRFAIPQCIVRGIGVGDLECAFRNLANIVVAFTTFGTSYLLFHGQQPLANLSANQLENTQQSAFAKKSDRLAIKEEEEEEDQVVSPKVVRLEKYALPASDEENPPKLDLSYLADYAYSEVPLDKKPADIVLDALKNIPIGKPIEEIKLASEAFGLDFNFMKAVPRLNLTLIPNSIPGHILGYSNSAKVSSPGMGLETFLILAITLLRRPTSSLLRLCCSN